MQNTIWGEKLMAVTMQLQKDIGSAILKNGEQGIVWRRH
jgi:hypothetical protein